MKLYVHEFGFRKSQQYDSFNHLGKHSSEYCIHAVLIDEIECTVQPGQYSLAIAELVHRKTLSPKTETGTYNAKQRLCYQRQAVSLSLIHGPHSLHNHLFAAKSFTKELLRRMDFWVVFCILYIFFGVYSVHTSCGLRKNAVLLFLVLH
jgi:hypothetical protein